MPFRSKAQRRWMYATHPRMAKHWEEVTPKGKALPEKVKQSAFFDELQKISRILNEEERGMIRRPTAIGTVGGAGLGMYLGRKMGLPGRALAAIGGGIGGGLIGGRMGSRNAMESLMRRGALQQRQYASPQYAQPY